MRDRGKGRARFVSGEVPSDTEVSGIGQDQLRCEIAGDNETHATALAKVEAERPTVEKLLSRMYKVRDRARQTLAMRKAKNFKDWKNELVKAAGWGLERFIQFFADPDQAQADRCPECGGYGELTPPVEVEGDCVGVGLKCFRCGHKFFAAKRLSWAP